MGVCGLTVVLVPVAVVTIVLFALYVPVVQLDEPMPALAALRRSAALIRYRPVKVAALLVIAILLAAVAGPLLGTALILATNAPFPLANIVAGVTFAGLVPYLGLALAYAYFDARIGAERRSNTKPAAPDVLPIEPPEPDSNGCRVTPGPN